MRTSMTRPRKAPNLLWSETRHQLSDRGPTFAQNSRQVGEDLGQLVLLVFEGVEVVVETSLANDIQRGLAHPDADINDRIVALLARRLDRVTDDVDPLLSQLH